MNWGLPSFRQRATRETTASPCVDDPGPRAGNAQARNQELYSGRIVEPALGKSTINSERFRPPSRLIPFARSFTDHARGLNALHIVMFSAHRSANHLSLNICRAKRAENRNFSAAPKRHVPDLGRAKPLNLLSASRLERREPVFHSPSTAICGLSFARAPKVSCRLGTLARQAPGRSVAGSATPETRKRASPPKTVLVHPNTLLHQAKCPPSLTTTRHGRLNPVFVNRQLLTERSVPCPP